MLSLPAHLHEQLHREPNRIVATYVALNGTAKSVRASELVAAAHTVAAQVSALPLGSRSTVGIVHRSGLWLHAAWLGVIWSGHIPTIVAPPSPRMEQRKFAEGLRGIVAHLELNAVVLDGETRHKLGDLMPGDIPAVLSDGLKPTDVYRPPPAPIDIDAEVVVQHTSGTTGIQKAIGFTSRQIATHAGAYSERLQLRNDDVIVSWLPLYHDMGFIACFVTPLLLGVPIVEISPFDWVQSPGILFDAISAHRGTFCWLPNFAFKVLSEDRLLATAAADGKIWRLDGMRAFINCSEPVTASAIERFVTRLAAHGIRREQVIASYAMAENLFSVTQNEIGRPRTNWFFRESLQKDGRVRPAPNGAAGAVQLVSNGWPIATTSVEIRDPKNRILAEREVGQIHVSGTHLFRGYRRRPDLTSEVMDDRGFYATGDLGFISDGEIYVTGRVKDLIIIRGRNYYPHDIEALVGEIEGVNPGRVVAFGIPDEESGTEKLVLMLELLDGFQTNKSQIALAIRRLIAQSLDCTVGDLQIVPSRTLVKSTAGKLARADNRNRYLAQVGQP